ncbi:hypothetical protein FZ983_32310 [Azospirillum sp. B21]|uniref:hypothetical protein n=1 Tax=Azospirillum sp. B21 TaxID=2607496 RepID=UPI0011ED84E5|nr:hypothetical protein [Azospirillum sp. B21]KAA0572256.1 hypothetical protein FZ983_32310 [Azospirillum sp. B21]
MTAPTTTATTTATPEELAAKLDHGAEILGHGTGALMRDSAHVLRAQKLHTDRVDAKLVEQERQIEAQRAEVERLTMAEADRDAVLQALGYKPGPLGNDTRREVILMDATELRPEMVKAREKAVFEESSASLYRDMLDELERSLAAGGALLKVWAARKEAETRATTAEAALADLIALTGQTDAAKAVAVVATMLAGADHGSYGSVVREYAECKAALAAVTAERDRMREAPRYMDEIEAGRVAWSWIEDIVRRDGLKAPHTTIKTDRLKGDGGTVELWHKDRLVAVALVLRDCWNWSVLARMEFSGREEPSSAALSAKEATDER